MYFSEKSLKQINLSSKSKSKYKFYERVKNTKTNIIYKSKKINEYVNRVMNNCDIK